MLIDRPSEGFESARTIDWARRGRNLILKMRRSHLGMSDGAALPLAAPAR
jgi:hypothetical protein